MPAPTALLRAQNGREGEEASAYTNTKGASHIEMLVTTLKTDACILVGDATADFCLDLSAAPTADFETSETHTEHTYHTELPSRIENRKIPIPPHRFSPLRSSWPSLYPPLVQHLKLQVRMNIKNRTVELRTSRHTTDLGALQKGEDFVKAFALGFDAADAVALLRLDDLYAT
jgi:RNA-binding protein PNO1